MSRDGCCLTWKSRQGRRISLLLAATLCAVVPLIQACRVPDPPVFKDKSLGLIYDTAMEAELRSGRAPAIVATAFSRYVDTLAEPVAVTAWSDAACRWEVFVATNRDHFGRPGESNADDNRLLETVQFGRSDVLLPQQPRGKEPRTSPGRRLPALLPTMKKQRRDDDDVATASSHPLSEAEFLEGVNEQIQRSRQRDLLLFVHGFNVSFDAAVIRTAQIALDMPFNGAVVAYCWPSQGGVFSYEEDESINKASVAPFTQFLKSLRNGVPPDSRINIVVHSMGNRIVMESLSRLAESGEKWHSRAGVARPIANVALCAPDVGLADFHAWAPGVVAQTDRVTLYASSGDSALIASKGLHGEARAGDSWEPLTAPGIETIDCSRIDLTLMGHSYYGSNTDVLSDLFMLLKEDLPASRRPHLSELKTDAGASCFQFSGSAPEIFVAWHFEEN